MLMNDGEQLDNYIESSTNPSIIKWGAQNAESHGDFTTALKYYTSINDINSSVRVHCLSGNLKMAMQLVDLHPENHAAVYYIATELEHEDRISEAITYYTRSNSYGSAIRLAIEHGIDTELMQLALKSNEKHMRDVAKYFEVKGAIEKAITLYAKSKNTMKALELCFMTSNITMLESISAVMDPTRDKQALQIAAKYLSENGSHEAALKILIDGQKYGEVLSICESQGIRISEDLIDKIEFPPSISASDAKAIRNRIAGLCYSQGSYTIASKQYALVLIY
jgi:intraflagellar transport protein 140